MSGELEKMAGRAATGDVAAIEELLRGIHIHLLAFLHLLGIPRDDVEDLAQETAVRIIRGLREYDAGRAFLPWMRTIARNVSANYWRSQSRRRDHLTSFQAFVETGLSERDDDTQADQRINRLQHCIEGLPARQLQLVESHYRDRLNLRTVAERLGLTPNYVYQLLHRVRAALRRCIESKEPEVRNYGVTSG